MLNHHYPSLILQKSIADLISEARRGYIGILWWVVEPISYMAVFYVIFVILFKRGGGDVVASLLIGLVVWKWFAASILQSANCISANIGLIKQVYIPKTVFPAMVILTNTLKFMIVFVLLLIFLLAMGYELNVVWLSIPLLLCVQAILMFAIGSVLAAVVPFIPDLRLIIDNGMMLLFFLSGVFFDINSASEEMRFYLSFNPMLGIIESYRSVLLQGIWPDWIYLLFILLVSLILVGLGVFLLVRFDRTFAKVV